MQIYINNWRNTRRQNKLFTLHCISKTNHAYGIAIPKMPSCELYLQFLKNNTIRMIVMQNYFEVSILRNLSDEHSEDTLKW